jgi:SAM-dependent methyltransferase
MRCPLCNSSKARDSWMGATVYCELRYRFQECLECRSMYLLPMPNRQTLDLMYGDEYLQFISLEEAHSGKGGTKQVLEQLLQTDPGIFFDYGCGGGYLLNEVTNIKWKAYGLDFDRKSTEEFRDSNNPIIVNDLLSIPADVSFDVIHLGDVIEHLTDVNFEMPKILTRLKPGGTLIAQGPLEANFNLFLLGLRLKKVFRNTDSTMPPYHVSLSTASGQREFFLRFGLTENEFAVFEAAHPAPDKIGLADLKNIRVTLLFLLRKMSQCLSPLISSTAGNRYFYVGRKVG